MDFFSELFLRLETNMIQYVDMMIVYMRIAFDGLYVPREITLSDRFLSIGFMMTLFSASLILFSFFLTAFSPFYCFWKRKCLF